MLSPELIVSNGTGTELNWKYNFYKFKIYANSALNII